MNVINFSVYINHNATDVSMKDWVHVYQEKRDDSHGKKNKIKQIYKQDVK